LLRCLHMGHKFKRKQYRAQASAEEERETGKGEVSRTRARVGKEAEIDVTEEDILEELAADDLARMEGPDA
jgi:hypothetical protein